MTDPSEHIGQIIDQHREHERNGGSGCCYGCRAEGLPDHSRHVAQAIVDRLGLTRESADDLSGKIRYVSAWFDDQLTKLEGAE